MSEFEVKSFICLKVRWLKDEIAIENFSLDAYSIQSIRELLESLTNVTHITHFDLFYLTFCVINTFYDNARWV